MAIRRRIFPPVAAVIFQTDHIGKFGGDEEGFQLCRVPAAAAVGGDGHGIHAELLQSADCPVFVGGAEHRALPHQEVLEDLPPADAAVYFGEVTVPIDFKPEGPAALDLPENLPLGFFQFGEGIFPFPFPAEHRIEFQGLAHGTGSLFPKVLKFSCRPAAG